MFVVQSYDKKCNVPNVFVIFVPTMSLITAFGNMLRGLLRYCVVCHRPMRTHHFSICSHCVARLPFVHYRGAVGNPMERLLWSNAYDIGRAQALLLHRAPSVTTIFVRHFKHHEERALLTQLTRMAVAELRDTDFFATIDAVVPVPLSRERQRQRGYNQAAVIAETVARETGLPCLPDLLQRVVDNPSLSAEHVADRVAGVAGIFRAAPEGEAYRHILLVDDTITTGATLRECAHTMADAHPRIHTFSFLTLFVASGLHVGYGRAEVTSNDDELIRSKPTP